MSATPRVDPVTGLPIGADGKVDLSNGIPLRDDERTGKAFTALRAAIEVANVEEAARARAKQALDALQLAHIALPFLEVIPVAGPFIGPIEQAIEKLLAEIAG